MRNFVSLHVMKRRCRNANYMLGEAQNVTEYLVRPCTKESFRIGVHLLRQTTVPFISLNISYIE
jgi:hypothetical protein